MSQLVEVGFANREENLRLLRKNGGDINKVCTNHLNLVCNKCYKFDDAKSRTLRKGWQFCMKAIMYTLLLSYKTAISVAVIIHFKHSP